MVRNESGRGTSSEAGSAHGLSTSRASIEFEGADAQMPAGQAMGGHRSSVELWLIN